MDWRAGLITVLMVVLTSGCLNGEDTEAMGGEAVEVQGLSVSPDSMPEGSRSNVDLQIRNSGNIPALVPVDSGLNESYVEECIDEQGIDVFDNVDSTDAAEYTQCLADKTDEEELWENHGDRILTDSCRDMLDVDHFDVTAPGNIDSDQYMLAPGDQMEFSWILDSDGANVPIQGYTCNLRMEVPFDYSVTAFRQFRVLESTDVEGIPDLQSQSSQGPMMIDLETFGSSIDESQSLFTEDDPAELAITLRNQRDDGTEYTGIVNAEPPEVEASGFEFEEECPPEDVDELTIIEGESETLRCPIDTGKAAFDEVDNMEAAEITAQTDYSFVKTLGAHELELEYAN